MLLTHFANSLEKLRSVELRWVKPPCLHRAKSVENILGLAMILSFSRSKTVFIDLFVMESALTSIYSAKVSAFEWSKLCDNDVACVCVCVCVCVWNMFIHTHHVLVIAGHTTKRGDRVTLIRRTNTPHLFSHKPVPITDILKLIRQQRHVDDECEWIASKCTLNVHTLYKWTELIYVFSCLSGVSMFHCLHCPIQKINFDCSWIFAQT